MNREQMISWMILEGWEYKQYQFSLDQPVSHFVVNNNHEWIRDMVGEDRWRRLDRFPDNKETESDWRYLPDEHLAELLRAIGV